MHTLACIALSYCGHTHDCMRKLTISSFTPLPFILAHLAAHHAQQDAPERETTEGTAHRTSELHRDASSAAAFARALQSSNDQGEVVGNIAQEQRKIEIFYILVHFACHAA